MPIKGFALLAVILSLFIGVNGVYAMNPHVRLPEWHQTTFAISEWNPNEGILVLRVEICANAVTLRKISSKLILPKNIVQNIDARERGVLKKGEKAVFLHRLTLKPGFSGWIEIDLRAQPSQEELLQLVQQMHDKEPVTAKVLEEEIKYIVQPITIGTSLPITLRQDIAISAAEELLFKTDTNSANRNFYLWYPPAGIGKGIAAESIKSFDGAIRTGNIKTAEAVANMLIKRFASSDEPLVLEKAGDENFMIPAKMVIELLNADMIIMRAIASQDSQELEKFINNMKPGFIRPFLNFNLGLLHEKQKAKDKAVEAFQKALKDIPAWPAARNKIKKFGRKGDK